MPVSGMVRVRRDGRRLAPGRSAMYLELRETPMTSPTTKATRRSKMFVDPEVQGGLIRMVALHWGLFFLCNSFALLLWMRLFEQPDAAWGETLVDCVRRFLPFFIITTALIPAFVWDTLKLTNRFAGPMTRLRSALAEAGAGRSVPPLRFRDGDYWIGVAEDFNRVMNRARLADVDWAESGDSDAGVPEAGVPEAGVPDRGGESADASDRKPVGASS